MQFGVFTVGDETPDPPRGRAPSEAQRIAAMVAIAGKTEEVGLDVFATDKHHNPPFAMLQHLAGGRVDLMLGRGNTAPVHPWFGQDIRTGIPLAIESYALLRRLWREAAVDWEGRFRAPLQGFTSTPRPLDDVPLFLSAARRRFGVRRPG